MDKKHIITIAGKPGSGKSTTATLVANALQYGRFSSGDLFRAVAKERDIDVYQINVLAEDEKEIDFMVDEKLRQIGAEQDNLVIDSRMAWHWMPYSFRVYLDLDITVAAERILSNIDPKRREAEAIPETTAAYAAVLQKRLDSEIKRYKNLYNANPYDPENYDLVVDSAAHDPNAVTDIILAAYKKWLS